jgi:hypothetical protein
VRAWTTHWDEEEQVLYELRSYDIDPTLLDEYVAWANDRALPILQGQFGFRMIGFWHAVAPKEGQAPATNVHWLIAWHDEDEMLSRWQEATATSEWKAIGQGQPKFHLKGQRTLLRAIPRSPYQ